MHELRTYNLYALEDFTQVSEDELLSKPNVGRATIRQIHSYLKALGLDFKPSSHPVRNAVVRTRIARQIPPEQRQLSNASHISDLGLRPFTVNRCLEKNILTVGMMRQQSLRDLYGLFGKKSLQEIVETLGSVGIELQSKPAQLEKWRYSAITKEHLKYPADDARVGELAPWLGSLTSCLEGAGIATVGGLRALALADGKAVRGMGRSSWERVFEHFGVRRRGGS